jgi:hypothetical protein
MSVGGCTALPTLPLPSLLRSPCTGHVKATLDLAHTVRASVSTRRADVRRGFAVQRAQKFEGKYSIAGKLGTAPSPSAKM